MNTFQKGLAVLLSWSLVIGTVPAGSAYAKESPQSEAQPTDPGTTQSREELQQLVAPIALYPDALVSQILAGATYPTEIVQASASDRHVQSFAAAEHSVQTPASLQP